MNTERRRDANGGVLPRADVMLRRGVVSMEEFAREKRSGRKLTPQERIDKYGSKIAPIPVPLQPGETEEQYEARFIAQVDLSHGYLPADIDKERVLRCAFAMIRWHEYEDKQKALGLRAPSTAVSTATATLSARQTKKTGESTLDGSSGMTPLDIKAATKQARLQTPREELLVKRYVDLENHRADVRNGLFTNVNMLSKDERKRRFGSEIVPIYVPLERGETMQQYEDRFVKWVWEKEALTMEELVRHPNPLQERFLRIMFAKANTSGHVYFVPTSSKPKRARGEDVELQKDQALQKKPKEDTLGEVVNRTVKTTGSKSPAPVRGSCTGRDTISSAIACGCRRCLVSGMRQLATKISGMEGFETKKRAPRRQKRSRINQVVDLTSDNESTTSSTSSVGRSTSVDQASTAAIDPVEVALMRSYDAINEQIVMNEKVLESSALQLAITPASDRKVTTQVQDEDQEMRELIRDEMPKRSVALAVLILYLWRDEIHNLTKLVDDSNATNVVYVQRAAHHKCATLAEEIRLKQRVVSDLDARLQAVRAGDSSNENERQLKRTKLGALRAEALADVNQFHEQRRREFNKLINFDQHIRQLIQALLATV